MKLNDLKIQNNFDLLRLILAILVYFAHWNTLTSQSLSNPLFHLSGFAVDMFFIGFSEGNFAQIVKYFISNIFFLNFLAPSVGPTLGSLEVNAINGSLWTLKNEVVFYALVPLIFMLYKKWGGYFLVILYSLSVLYMFGVNYLGVSKLLVQFPAQLRLFIVGILLYGAFDRFKDKNITLWVIGSFVLIVFFGENNYFKFSSYPLLLGIIVIWLVYFVKHIKINFDFSYSFYILHFPVIQLALYFGLNPSNPFISFVSLFAVILVLSYFSEKYIEKKFIQVGKNMLKRSNNNEK